MGKTKIKTIDDSQPVDEKPAKKPEDSLVAKLKEELGIPEDGKKSEKKVVKKEEKAQKKVRSKKYQEAIKDLDRTRTYPLPEALDMIKKLSYAKFNATLEAHINTLHAGIRGLVSLPHAAGKKLKILVFAKAGEDFSDAVLGDDSTISEIEKGKVDFDLIIATAQWMPALAKLAKILGPKGLMPNPKNGTITDDPKKVVESFQAGKTEYKTEPKAPVIHLGLGKLNQPNEELAANVKALISTLGKTKIKKVTLSPTMGPGIKVDLASI